MVITNSVNEQVILRPRRVRCNGGFTVLWKNIFLPQEFIFSQQDFFSYGEKKKYCYKISNFAAGTKLFFSFLFGMSKRFF